MKTIMFSPATAPRSLSSLGKATSGVKLGWPLSFLIGYAMRTALVPVSLASSSRQPFLIPGARGLAWLGKGVSWTPWAFYRQFMMCCCGNCSCLASLQSTQGWNNGTNRRGTIKGPGASNVTLSNSSCTCSQLPGF